MNQTTKSIAYANWLNTMNWDYYCTFTTKYSLSMKSARRAMDRLYSLLKNNNAEVKIFWVAEPFDVKYGYHTHALVSFNSSVAKNIKSLLEKAWQIVSKGKGGKEYNHTVLKPYEKELGANHYVAKYLMRDNADHDFLF